LPAALALVVPMLTPSLKTSMPLFAAAVPLNQQLVVAGDLVGCAAAGVVGDAAHHRCRGCRRVDGDVERRRSAGGRVAGEVGLYRHHMRRAAGQRDVDAEDAADHVPVPSVAPARSDCHCRCRRRTG
jgi:hypothetical protein